MEEKLEGISQIVIRGKNILRVRTAKSNSLKWKHAWHVLAAADESMWLEQSERGEWELGKSEGYQVATSCVALQIMRRTLVFTE